jgi:hypothetical protein
MIRELAWSEDRGKVVVVPGAPDNPVNIPHDIEYRGLATGIDQKLNPEVSGGIRPSPQVTESARLSLSRGRHGFEPRWDYQRKRDLGAHSNPPDIHQQERAT